MPAGFLSHVGARAKGKGRAMGRSDSRRSPAVNAWYQELSEVGTLSGEPLGG